MKKSLIIAVFVHIALFSLVWVGFAMPLPRDNVQFFYSGSFMPVDELSGQDASEAKEALRKSVSIKTAEGAFFTPWVQMRELNKPRK